MLRGRNLPGSYTGRSATYLLGSYYGESSGVAMTTLSLTMGSSANPAPAGNNFSITADLSNTGSSNATNVTVTITLDASLTYVSSSGTGWSIGVVGQVVTATRAVAAPGAAPTITITVTAGNSNASTTTGGSAVADNSGTATASQGVTVTQLTQTVVVTDSADPVITGADAFSYTVQVHNSGLSGVGTANNLSCAITLDSSLTYVSSSGTGWSIGVSGQVVTATLSSLSVGDANPITINVTTGTSGLTASTSAALTADNATTANGSQSTTVNLVTKDATAGIYFPASSTEWTNFISRKALSISVPDALWLMQDASGNPADAIGSFTLTASGTGISYQNAVTGFSRKAINTTAAGSGVMKSTSASLPDVSTASAMMMAVANVTAPSGAIRVIGGVGTSGFTVEATTTPKGRLVAGSTVDTTNNPCGAVIPWVWKRDRNLSADRLYTNADKVAPTFGSGTGKQAALAAFTATSPAAQYLYVVGWWTTKAEVSDANIKAMLQALGWTITWS